MSVLAGSSGILKNVEERGAGRHSFGDSTNTGISRSVLRW